MMMGQYNVSRPYAPPMQQAQAAPIVPLHVAAPKIAQRAAFDMAPQFAPQQSAGWQVPPSVLAAIFAKSGANGAKGGHEEHGISAQAQAAYDRFAAAWDRPLTVTSGYRDPAKNAAVGGAKGSQHMHGNAFDISTAGLNQAQIQDMIRRAQSAGFRGVGVYNNSVHFDVGPARAWGSDYTRKTLPAWAAGVIG